jgi:sigma-54 specific flagellar transcriptional regulator A
VIRRDVERYLDLPSRAMRDVVGMVQRVAPLGTTVFIQGPSGSGKEFVARALHLMSDRAAGPFVPVNCGAIPRDLLESELFGSEKGAYTGSVRTRAGLMEMAAGGTLFLDEIGDMPMDMQVKLLRVLEERAFTRIGGNQPIKVDVRFVCATHRNLEQMIEAGTFREDLYYRINVFPIEILPLAERVEDIPKLIALIVERFQAQGFLHAPRLTECGIAALQARPWPGNIRQLRNVLERAGILYQDSPVDKAKVEALFRAPSTIDPVVEANALWDAVGGLNIAAELAEAKHDAIQRETDGLDDADIAAIIRRAKRFNLKDYISQIETDFIRAALKDAEGSVSGAARILGFQRTTLIEKIRKFSIEKTDA